MVFWIYLPENHEAGRTFLSFLLKMMRMREPTRGQVEMMAMYASSHIDLLLCRDSWFIDLFSLVVISSSLRLSVELLSCELWPGWCCVDSAGGLSVSISSFWAATTIPSSARLIYGLLSIEDCSDVCGPRSCVCIKRKLIKVQYLELWRNHIFKCSDHKQ